MFWSKKPSPPRAGTRQVGLDLNASRALAVSLLANRTRCVNLDDSAEDLPLFVDLSQRSARVGRSGRQLCRRQPHLVCSNFLPLLGQAKQWQAGRLVVSPEAALAMTFEAVLSPLQAESESLALSLPAYLTPVQVRTTLELARQAKLPVIGSASTPVAIAAHRAAYLLEEHRAASEDHRPDWVVPIRPTATGTEAVVLVDADEYALTVSVVQVEARDVKLMAFQAIPKLSLKSWSERLLDGFADRCVRQCRRDPRDSAEAEQILYNQLDAALDQAQLGQPARVAIRSEHWYQDLLLSPDELDHVCAKLSQQSAAAVRETVQSADLSSPPRAVWLSHAAARLPGLAKVIFDHSDEQSDLLSLPAQAAADAVAWLIRRWTVGELPKAHLDGVVPLEVAPSSSPNQKVP